MNEDLNQNWHLDKRIPVALILTLIGYGLFGTWWASRLETRVTGHDKRIETLEAATVESAKTQATINERLGRIEERANAQVMILERIERRLVPR